MNRSEYHSIPERDHSVAPEEALLQITLAFMVFLGFLVSDEVVNKTALSEELHDVETGINFIMNTPKKEILEKHNQAVLIEQKYKLLGAWWRLRSEERLFQLTAFFGDDKSPLYEASIDGLRANLSFRLLHDISLRYFNDPSGKNIDTKIEEVVNTIIGAPVSPPNSRAAQHQVGDSSKLLGQTGRMLQGKIDPNNIKMLRQEIKKDFQDQRRQVVDIQSTVFNRLLTGNIENWLLVDLRQVVDDWNKDLPMLPEVKTKFEQVSLKSRDKN